MIKPLVFAGAILCGALLAPSAWAQSAPGAPGTDQVIPEKERPATTLPSGAAPSPNLSDKLSKSNGVLTPPADVDPGMTKPAPTPNPNSTPVIRPPGTPGGPAGAQPK